ncbi:MULTISPECIES: SDR family oxidoreductase [unclassified Chitinophaga]|uniref:SDR family NAD(P)-dependent oxidoreductase n=1 Tax=unclassified Chitinophaga TaxID=2619133 RepID=UPI0009C97C01|nr:MULTISPECIES: SDR family oxidoreductase [unclassified Chitinophaga]OMP77721.1 short-chain dehydrogenase [[Flexibacter] sp. ATCC 35208]WPV65567.1 SDR family oxidoreductase [Chitinophaga sp. LS1]
MNYALITGASKGIGRSIAIVLAKKKYNLILVARSTSELQVVASELITKYGVQVDYLGIDLSVPTAAGELFEWVQKNQYNISILINNAGYAVWGEFDKTSLEDQNKMLQVNMQTPMALCHHFLPMLLQQPAAYIMNVASTAAYQAVPTLSTYAATKAFMLLFTRGLRADLKGTNVSVTALSPGPVNTNFIDRAGMQAIKATAEKYGMMPDEVARIAVNGMFAKKSELIPGALNAATAFVTRLVPKGMVEKIAGNLYKK